VSSSNAIGSWQWRDEVYRANIVLLSCAPAEIAARVRAAVSESTRHQRFVDEYLLDLNAADAYRRAGYKARGNSAEVNAIRLLRKAQVAAAVAEGMKSRAARVGITQDRVLASSRCSRSPMSSTTS
jgi:hypothetical protein